MFLSAILLALIVGAFAGGGLPRLADLKLRWLSILALALTLRLLATWAGANDALPGFPLGWAYVFTYLLILAWLAGNWRIPGLQIASVGIAANTLAVIINAGQMPIWPAAYAAAGFAPDAVVGDPFHFLLEADSIAGFVASGGLFGDVIPIPLPLIRDVMSIGDVLLALGIFWAIVYSMTRPFAPRRASFVLGSMPSRPIPAAAFGAGAGYGSSAQPLLEGGAPAVTTESPYLRLIRNRDFSLLWVGQLVSYMGDRIHVVALAFLVAARGTPLDVGLTFAATAVPNVLLGPLAGVLVDRWDRRWTMVGSDVVRAALVLSVPFAIEIHIALVYLASFLIATVTLLFRPAKTAVIPAIVDEHDLVTANSATSVSDTAADLIGYPIAGAIVALMAGSIAFAFVLDAATYVLSALLIFLMRVPRTLPEDANREPMSIRAVWSEMAEGWQFLRGQAELFSNTLVSTVAQVAVGAEIVVSVIYARTVLDTSRIGYPLNFSLLLAAVGVGSVVGGLAVGAIGDRLPKGPVILAGFVGMGLALIGAGLTSDPVLAIGAFLAVGVANMLFIVPTITLFQERTPQRLMGRVVSTRQALVFGSIAASMGLSGWASGVFDPAFVLIGAGAICAAAGIAGVFIPAMRNAR